MKRYVIAALLLVGCTKPPPIPTFPSSPYFTDQTLHTCLSKTGQTQIFIEPLTVDGFYNIEVWIAGQIPLIDEVNSLEVLGGDPVRMYAWTPRYPWQVVWRARAADNWQPASRKYEESDKPTNYCNFQ